MDNSTLKHEVVQIKGLNIHYVTAGEGPLVILLHGFPQCWYTWRHQILALSEHFKVVAPDLRGYGDSDKPPNISDYSMPHLTADVVGLIQVLGNKKAHIVGHDWGGAIAWQVALEYPDVVDHLVVLNAPHPAKFLKALRSNFSQLRRSWYIFFFQLPLLPEWIFKRNPQKVLTRMFKTASTSKESFTNEDINHYVAAIQKPGALTAALNYYRAVFRKRGQKSHPAARTIKAPTLLIWGENDVALGKELTYEMEPLFEGTFRIEYIKNCSHWVNEEQPELVNQLLLNFLT